MPTVKFGSGFQSPSYSHFMGNVEIKPLLVTLREPNRASDVRVVLPKITTNKIYSHYKVAFKTSTLQVHKWIYPWCIDFSTRLRAQLQIKTRVEWEKRSAIYLMISGMMIWCDIMTYQPQSTDMRSPLLNLTAPTSIDSVSILTTSYQLKSASCCAISVVLVFLRIFLFLVRCSNDTTSIELLTTVINNTN